MFSRFRSVWFCPALPCIALPQSAEIAQLCGSILMNVSKTKSFDGMANVVAGLDSLTQYVTRDSREPGPLTMCLNALANICDAVDVGADVVKNGNPCVPLLLENTCVPLLQQRCPLRPVIVSVLHMLVCCRLQGRRSDY